MEWNSNTIAEIFRPLKVSPFTRDELNYSGGNFRNVHYGDILVKFPSVIDVEKEGLPYVNDASEPKCGRCSLLQDGDVIIADTAEDEAVGKVIEIQGTTGQKVVSGLHTIAYRPQEGFFAPGFLGYFLNSSVYHNQLLPLMQGIKVLSLSRSALADTVINYPSYAEQERIADALSSIDALIAGLDEAIEKKRQIKEGLMQNLLTGRTRIPGFSGEWQEVRLGDVANVKSGFAFKSETYTPIGKYKVITIANVLNGELNTSDCNRIDVKPKSLQDFHELKRDDIIVSMTGNVGRVCKVNEQNCLLNQRVGLIVPQKECLVVTTDFLYSVLNSKYFERMMIEKGQGAAQANLSNKDIESYVFPAPISAEEQNLISYSLQVADNEIETLRFKQNKYVLLKQGMMQELLTGKTRLI